MVSSPVVHKFPVKIHLNLLAFVFSLKRGGQPKIRSKIKSNNNLIQIKVLLEGFHACCAQLWHLFWAISAIYVP